MRTTTGCTALVAAGAMLLAVHDTAVSAEPAEATLLLAQSEDDEGGMLRRREQPEEPGTSRDEPETEETGTQDEQQVRDEDEELAPGTLSLPVPEDQTYEPEMDSVADPGEYEEGGFRPDPRYAEGEYSVEDQIEIYGGKRAIDAPRPLLELGYPLYAAGTIGAGHDVIGRKNLVRPQFLLFGDWRTAVGRNVVDDQNEFSRAATRLNLNANLDITATERVHALFRPLEDDGEFTRHVFDQEVNGQPADNVSEVETSLEPVTLFFEGDVGRLWAGFTDEHNSLDLPFSVGRIPLFVQNGIWLDDAFDGFAFAIPALNSPALDISNADIAFYGGFNEINTAGIPDSQDEAALLAVATFIERRESYYEFDYGFVQDQSDGPVDRSYHTVALGWTRRFGAALSHSTRLIGNFGQDEDDAGVNTADGALLLLENSFITSRPYTLIPYVNLFYGDGTPQPLARTVGGLLQNTGINFEADAITGFQSLTPFGHNAYGAALGIENLFDLNRQVVIELAGLSRHGDDSDQGDEYALGARFQQPFAQQWIFRADAVTGVKEATEGSGAEDADFSSVRMELRVKF